MVCNNGYAITSTTLLDTHRGTVVFNTTLTTTYSVYGTKISVACCLCIVYNEYQSGGNSHQEGDN
nr:MAG TPA: hypothetical protein [Caudoviricetes sp.]